MIDFTAQPEEAVRAICVSIAHGGDRGSAMNIRWRKRSGQKATTEAECVCGNHPLTEEDIAQGGLCVCCRKGHFSPHDINDCIRCGAPIND